MENANDDVKVVVFIDYFVEKWLDNSRTDLWNCYRERHWTKNAAEYWNHKFETKPWVEELMNKLQEAEQTKKFDNEKLNWIWYKKFHWIWVKRDKVFAWLHFRRPHLKQPCQVEKLVLPHLAPFSSLTPSGMTAKGGNLWNLSQSTYTSCFTQIKYFKEKFFLGIYI